MVDVDNVFDKIGLWHIPVFLVVTLRSWPLGFNVLFLSFAASPKQDHWCARPEGFKEIYSVQEWKELAIPRIGEKYSRYLDKLFNVVDAADRKVMSNPVVGDEQPKVCAFDFCLDARFGSLKKSVVNSRIPHPYGSSMKLRNAQNGNSTPPTTTGLLSARLSNWFNLYAFQNGNERMDICTIR